MCTLHNSSSSDTFEYIVGLLITPLLYVIYTIVVKGRSAVDISNKVKIKNKILHNLERDGLTESSSHPRAAVFHIVDDVGGRLPGYRAAVALQKRTDGVPSSSTR